MCIEVRTYYNSCGHYRYQNTYLCYVVQRCAPGDAKMAMDRALALPAPPSRVPPGLLNCKMRRAARPVDDVCGDCAGAVHSGMGALVAREEGASGTRGSNSNKNDADGSAPDPQGNDGPSIPGTPVRTAGESRSSEPRWHGGRGGSWQRRKQDKNTADHFRSHPVFPPDQEALPLDPTGSEAIERMRKSFLRMSLLSQPLDEKSGDAVDQLRTAAATDEIGGTEKAGDIGKAEGTGKAEDTPEIKA